MINDKNSVVLSDTNSNNVIADANNESYNSFFQKIKNKLCTVQGIIIIVIAVLIITLILILLISYFKLKNKLTDMKNRESEYALDLLKEILGGQKNSTENKLIIYNQLNEEIIKENIKNSLKTEITDDMKNKLKTEIENEIKNEIKSYIKDKIINEVKNEIKYDVKEDTKTELKGEIIDEMKKDIKKEMKYYTDNLLKENLKNYIKINDTINADKLQNRIVGTEKDCIVKIENNGKIYPNIIFTKGMIIAWFGYLNQIPDKWAICDGTQGTPDLRNKFILGNSNDTKLGETGGKTEITLSKTNLPKIGKGYFSTDSHSGGYHHSSNGFIKYQNSYSASIRIGNTDDWGSDLLIDLEDGMDSSPINIMNPYYSLYYIMKL